MCASGAWTASARMAAPPAEPAAERVVKGGAFFFTASGTRLPLRYALSPSLPIETVGFRLFAPLEMT